MSSKPFVQIAVPGIAALLAIAVAMGGNQSGNATARTTAAPTDGPTPYSADHARVQATAPDTEQPPTF